MKNILISIKPYYVFLIIAHSMGWDIPNPKTIEVRKSCPKDKQWDHKVLIYCTKDKESFHQIPKQYQPAMKAFLGRVIGEFVCDEIEEFTVGGLRCDDIEKEACLAYEEIITYFYKPEELDGKHAKFGYGWHISDLKIYDRLKDLDELRTGKNIAMPCGYGNYNIYEQQVLRPPQSWMYIKEVQSRRDEWYEPETIVLFNSDHQLGCARAYCPRCGVCLGECSLTDPLNVLDYQRCCPVCGAKIKAEPTK